jgi:hypothetical protein
MEALLGTYVHCTPSSCPIQQLLSNWACGSWELRCFFVFSMWSWVIACSTSMTGM